MSVYFIALFLTTPHLCVEASVRCVNHAEKQIQINFQKNGKSEMSPFAFVCVLEIHLNMQKVSKSEDCIICSFMVLVVFLKLSCHH